MGPHSPSRRHFLWTLSASVAACASDGKGLSGGSTTGGDSSGTGGTGGSSGGNGTGTNGAMPGGEDGGTPDGGEQLPPIDAQPAFDFLHGVASGDPLKDRVILWTRATPTDDKLEAGTELAVDFVVATDTALKNVIGKGRATTTSERDYTVKVDVDGLSPGSTYYYQFHDPAMPSVLSPVGRTRTLPEGSLERARFAVMSCSCYALGYFNAYAHVAARPDIEAVLHLGDYIYEYGPDVYNNADLDRAHEPAKEAMTFEDYRTRHKQYKTDPDLNEAHRQHPFITIWDDHEVANDAWKEGAENHTAGTEGDYKERQKGAYRAYHEWMPIRDLDPKDDTKIYRSFAYGDLCDLIMLETRAHRDSQNRAEAASATRKLMTDEQLSWLEAQLADSKKRGATWRLLGQQMMMGQLTIPGVNIPNADQWDGYTAERERLLGYVESEGIDNLVVLTGDIHSSWAMEVAKDGTYDGGKGALAVEYVCTSITSPALPVLNGLASFAVLQFNPHMKWSELDHRGYLLLDVDHTRVQGDWYHADTIAEPNSKHSFVKAFRTDAGTPKLIEEKTATQALTGAPDFAP